MFPWGFFGVIWALGACMVLMAAIVRMPLRWVGAFSAVLILGHDLLDPIRPRQFGSWAWLWTILHVRGGALLPFGLRKFVLFPLVPWVGVMAAGYVFGSIYLLEKDRRRKLIAQIGLGLTLAFVLLRLTNLYGNPPAGLSGVSQGPWHVQPTIEKTVILFFDVEKYPPSLQFLLMTLGPSLLLLAWLDKKLDQRDGKQSVSPWLSPLLTFGRVPLFFYILHLYLIHSLAILAGVLSHQPVGWLFHGGFMFGAPGRVGIQSAVRLSDVDHGSGHSVFSVPVVRGGQAAAEGLVVELHLRDSVSGCQRSLRKSLHPLRIQIFASDAKNSDRPASLGMTECRAMWDDGTCQPNGSSAKSPQLLCILQTLSAWCRRFRLLWRRLRRRRRCAALDLRRSGRRLRLS